jgi:hypothetical protein
LSQVFLRGNFRFVGDLHEGQERFFARHEARFEVVVVGLKSEAGRRPIGATTRELQEETNVAPPTFRP